MDASGTSWAPGGALATNSLKVKGRGTYVNWAAVSYQTGTNVQNACVDQFEVAFYSGGKRRVRTAGRNCAVFRTTHTFNFGYRLDANKPFCGRVKVGGSWGNYACVQIKR